MRKRNLDGEPLVGGGAASAGGLAWLAKAMLAAALPALAASLWMSAAWAVADFFLSDGWQPISAVKLQLLHRAYSPDTTFLATVLGTAAALPVLLRAAPPPALRRREAAWRPMGFAALFCAALSLLLNCALIAVPNGIPEAGFANAAAILRDSYGEAGKPLMLLAAVLTGPVFEEIVFRGLSHGGMRRCGMPPVAAALLSAALFGAYHGSPRTLAYTAVMGAAFALLYERYGSLLVPIAGHCAGNAAVFSMEFFPKAWGRWDLVGLWMAVCGVVLFYSVAFLCNHANAAQRFRRSQTADEAKDAPALSGRGRIR